MADGRKKNGGYREGGGRKSKAEELDIKGKLSPMEPEFLKQLNRHIKAGNLLAMKLWAEYYYGKPSEKLDITTGGEKLNRITVDIIHSNGKESNG